VSCSSLYSNDNHITSLVNTYYIAGYGYNTVNKIRFNMLDWYVYSNTNYGDKLVAEWSSTLGDKYPSRTFYVCNTSHMGLVSDTEVRDFVTQLISGNTSTSSYSDIFENIP